MAKKSVALDRGIKFYPKPVYLNKLNNLSAESGESKSSLAGQALKEFFDRREKK
jgi:hypothetical protein